MAEGDDPLMNVVPRRQKSMTALVLLITAAVLSAITLALTSSILWVWGLWALCGMAAAYAGGARRLRMAGFTIGALATILAVTEIVLGLDSRREREPTLDPPAFIVTDTHLGRRARPDSQARARLIIDDALIYDVVYTTDAHGLRISPPADDGMPANCALFFGDSFTFGEGVADEQAMPYVAAGASGGRYRTRNFGFPGYGAHHMLAAIETGWVREAARCEPKVAVYWALLHHVMRAAGSLAWEDHGPRYDLQADGSVKRNGNFGPRDTWLARAARISRLANRLNNSLALKIEDLELYFAIVRASRDKLVALYPGIELHVILWDTGHAPEAFLKPWSRDGITLHRVSRILPDWDNRDWLYQLPRDTHPNADADKLLGGYVAEHILSR